MVIGLVNTENILYDCRVLMNIDISFTWKSEEVDNIYEKIVA